MKVISVKFKENGRSYYFDPQELRPQEGDYVIVETARGTECGEVVRGLHDVPGFNREDWYLTAEGRAMILGEVRRLGDQVNEVFAMMLEQIPLGDR